jgi:hypothetical protein
MRTDKITLPEFGAHLSPRTRLYKLNELLAAPFPEAETTEEILSIAQQIAERGFLIVGKAQRPLRLRAPHEDERAIVVGETTDQTLGEEPTLFRFTGASVATGKINSALWFCHSDYPFLGSYHALQQYWARNKQKLQMNALIRAGIAEP